MSKFKLYLPVFLLPLLLVPTITLAQILPSQEEQGWICMFNCESRLPVNFNEAIDESADNFYRPIPPQGVSFDPNAGERFECPARTTHVEHQSPFMSPWERWNMQWY
ncbi:MAG TPA: hypothetical protein VEA59_02705 [Patescibacteria group bacterium]|nr:hypothetical protein [Patescibacteria group bacterium]